MMLIAICSLKSSPGVTTLATAIAARWPLAQTPILVEADPAGGDLAARFRLGMTPNLVSLAAAARRSRAPDLLGEHAQRLPGGLAIVVGPIGAEQTRAALDAISAEDGPLRRAADDAGTAVIVDCGRMDPDSPALPILRCADAMLLLTRARDDELAHVAQRLPAVPRWTRRPCLVLVGNGHSHHDVSTVLGVPVMTRMPHDAKGAAVLCGQPDRRHGPDRSRIGQAAARIAFLLSGESEVWHRASTIVVVPSGSDAVHPMVSVNGRSS